MLYTPVHALAALTRFQPLEAGDLMLTGTPVGTALSAPPKPIVTLVSLLPPNLKWKLFFKAQAKNPRYLNGGDVIDATVSTDDGAIDLGAQRLVVRHK
jgi:2-keto-4-pentenoate hydratase/2-oxohepta-3-ene-1,7-dioic acid hydratase in catechol pathway